MSDLIDDKSNEELLESVLMETAKARNELACAKRDLNKAEGRMGFLIVLTNKLINRTKD